MRKIILWMFISLDGYFEGPGGDLSWHCVDHELQQHFNHALAGMGAFLNGRRTYELMAKFWPTVDQVYPDDREMIEYSLLWKRMPKLVYSRTLENAGWNSTLVRAVVPAEVLALKARPGGDMILGGADLAAAFMEHALIDEFNIYVNPVVLGKGRALFPEGGKKQALNLLGTRTFGNGVVLMRYGTVRP